MPLIPRSKSVRVALLVLVPILLACALLVFFAAQPSPEARHAQDTSIVGYQRIEKGPVGDSGIEAIYVGPPDEQILQKISAPGLKVNTRPRVHGPTRYDWVARGDFNGDDCRVYIERIDPESRRGQRYAKSVVVEEGDSPVDVISLMYVCGTG